MVRNIFFKKHVSMTTDNFSSIIGEVNKAVFFSQNIF